MTKKKIRYAGLTLVFISSLEEIFKVAFSHAFWFGLICYWILSSFIGFYAGHKIVNWTE